MFFFYSKDGAMCIIVSLPVLKLACSTDVASRFAPVPATGKWEQVTMFTMQAIATRGKITVLIDAEDTGGEKWRHPLAETPQPHRDNVRRALGAFTAGMDVSPDDLDVEVLAN